MLDDAGGGGGGTDDVSLMISKSASALIRLFNSLTIRNKNRMSSADVSCLSASLCGKRSMCAREIEVLIQFLT